MISDRSPIPTGIRKNCNLKVHIVASASGMAGSRGASNVIEIHSLGSAFLREGFILRHHLSSWWQSWSPASLGLHLDICNQESQQVPKPKLIGVICPSLNHPYNSDWLGLGLRLTFRA